MLTQAFIIFVPTCICLFFVPNPWTMYDFYPMKEIPCPTITDPSFFSTEYNFHGESYHVNSTLVDYGDEKINAYFC